MQSAFLKGDCCCLVTQSYPNLGDTIDCSPSGSSVHGISLGKDIGMHCPFLLQEIFLTQGSNPHPLHWQADSLPKVDTWCIILLLLKRA